MTKRNGRSADAKGRSTGETRHVRFYAWELKSAAFRSLSCAARALLIEFKSRHNGQNNGRIPLSHREAATILHRSRSKVGAVFEELQDRGFIRPIKAGAFTRKTKQATEWALNEYEMNGYPAGKAFMKWQPANPNQGQTDDQGIKPTADFGSTDQ